MFAVFLRKSVVTARVVHRCLLPAWTVGNLWNPPPMQLPGKLTAQPDNLFLVIHHSRLERSAVAAQLVYRCLLPAWVTSIANPAGQLPRKLDVYIKLQNDAGWVPQSHGIAWF
jgi:hypothetical protein